MQATCLAFNLNCFPSLLDPTVHYGNTNATHPMPFLESRLFMLSLCLGDPLSYSHGLCQPLTKHLDLTSPAPASSLKQACSAKCSSFVPVKCSGIIFIPEMLTSIYSGLLMCLSPFLYSEFLDKRNYTYLLWYQILLAMF